jgi:hypothetical protein
MALSGAASFSGVLCAVLTTKGKLSSFAWGGSWTLKRVLF